MLKNVIRYGRVLKLRADDEMITRRLKAKLRERCTDFMNHTRASSSFECITGLLYYSQNQSAQVRVKTVGADSLE